MRLTVGRKIGTGFMLVILLMIGSALLTYFKISEIRKEETAVLEVRFPLSVACYEMLTNLELTQTRSRDVILAAGDKSRVDAARQSWEKQWELVNTYMSKLQDLKVHFVRPENRERVDNIRAAFPSLREAQSKIFESAAPGSPAGINQAREILYTSSKPQNDAIKKTLRDLQDSAADLTAKSAVTLRADGSSMVLALCVSVALAVLFAAFLAVFLSRRISASTTAVLQQAEAIASGDLTHEEAKLVSQDELGDLTLAINKMHGNLRTLIESITNNAQQVATASEEFSATSQQITTNSEETSAQANVVSAATEQINRNLQTVATSTEEMSASISEIAKNATEAAKVAGEALKAATDTNATVSKLGDSSAEIGQVIKVITSIAQQTNLLALNATIEAARAGEAGKGFAVVANEVKELAKQTAKATEDIGQRIAAIQTDTKGAVEAIGKISEIIQRVNDISSTIATAVEEQSATTSEMSRNVTEAAKGSGEVAKNITGVAQAAQNTSHGATESQRAAQSLARMSTGLKGLVEQFKIDPSGNGRGPARRAAA